MTKAERAHLTAIAALGCVVCERLGLGASPAEIHHPRALVGAGQRAGHFDAIPLCPAHHRTGGHGTALHAGQRTWEARYGTELELLAYTRQRMAEPLYR